MEGLLIVATEAGQEARLLKVSLRAVALPRRRTPAKGGMEAQISPLTPRKRETDATTVTG